MWFLDIAALIGYVRTAPWGFQDLDWTRANRAFDNCTRNPSPNPSMPSPTGSRCWRPAEAGIRIDRAGERLTCSCEPNC
jgi:hypothetical protein